MKIKAGLLTSWLLLFIPIFAVASPDAPPSVYLSHSSEVLLTQVVSVEGDAVSFKISEVLKGGVRSALVLKPTLGMDQIFKSGEKYILCWMGDNSEKNIVCSSMFFGTPEWLCISVSGEGDTISVSGVGSLEKVKEICASRSP